MSMLDYIKKIRISRLLKIFLLLFVSFVCITINSKNSFLYTFNESSDIHQFVTTIRCIKKGDVLYRDIFEVKGPILYLLYYVGSFLNENPYHGVYIVEFISFSCYIFITYKIASMYLSNDILKISAAVISAYFSTITYNLFGGGQCEQFMLPVFALILYISLKYIRNDYPKRISFFKVFSIGILTAIIFWVKYALCGIILGLVLYIVIISIKNKRSIDILIYALEFLAGFSLVSAIVIGYFVYKGALSSLFEVYFYDMLFLYKPKAEVSKGLITTENIDKLFGASIMTAAALVYFIANPGKKMKRTEQFLLLTLMFSQAFGICLSRVWKYSPEPMHLYAVFGFIGLIYAIYDNREIILKLLKNICKAIKIFIDFGFDRVKWLIPVEIILLFLSSKGYSKYGLGEQVIIFFISILLIKAFDALSIYISSKVDSFNLSMVIKYAAIICLNVLVSVVPLFGFNNTASTIMLISSIVITINDIYFYRQNVKTFVFRIIKKFSERKYTRAISTLIVIIFMFEFTAIVMEKSPVALDIMADPESYAPYIISEYIKDSKIDDPIIVNFDLLDTGVYYLTGTYPPGRYISDYNFDTTAGFYDYRQKFIDTEKADFIIARDYVKLEGYTCVFYMDREYVIMDTDNDAFSIKRNILYAKDSIARANNWKSIDKELSGSSKYDRSFKSE